MLPPDPACVGLVERVHKDAERHQGLVPFCTHTLERGRHDRPLLGNLVSFSVNHGASPVYPA